MQRFGASPGVKDVVGLICASLSSSPSVDLSMVSPSACWQNPLVLKSDQNPGGLDISLLSQDAKSRCLLISMSGVKRSLFTIRERTT